MSKFFLQSKVLSQYGVDPARVCVAGDSAGGNLAAAVAQQVQPSCLRAQNLHLGTFTTTEKSSARSTRCSRVHTGCHSLWDCHRAPGAGQATVPEPLGGIGGDLEPSKHLSLKKGSLPFSWAVQHSNLKLTLPGLGMTFGEGILTT